MAFVKKTQGMLKLETAFDVEDLRQLLLESYGRHNTIAGVAKEIKRHPTTVSLWFKQLGLHTRASTPVQRIQQDLAPLDDLTDYSRAVNHPKNKHRAGRDPRQQNA